MAVDAELTLEGGHLNLDLYPGERRVRVSDDPPELPDFDPGSTTWPYYDGDALERGEYEFVGIEIADMARFRDEDLAALETLNLPRVTCREQGLIDVSVADALRWAKRAHLAALARGEGVVWGPVPAATGAPKPGPPDA